MPTQPTLREELHRTLPKNVKFLVPEDEIIDDILQVVVTSMEHEVSQFRAYNWRTLIDWVRKQ